MSATVSAATPGDEVGTVLTAEMGVCVEKKQVTCRIQNFAAFHSSNKVVKAQRFQFRAGDSLGLPTTWEIFLNTSEDGGNGAAKKKWTGVFLKLVKKPDTAKHVFSFFTVSVKKGTSGNFFKGTTTCQDMVEISGGWGYDKVIAQDQDLTDVVQDDGSLVIQVEFNLLSEKYPEDIPSKLKAFQDKSLQQLMKDLDRLRTTPETTASENSETKIVSSDKIQFPVNRGILSCRSSVFQRMFQQKMKESITGEVHIDDLSGKTVQVLLQYLYNGTLHQDWTSPEVIEELTSAAHRYDLGVLTNFLDDILGSICTTENAARLAILTRTLGMKKAERELFLFVKNNATSFEDLVEMVEPRKDLWSVLWNRSTGVVRAANIYFAVILAKCRGILNV